MKLNLLLIFVTSLILILGVFKYSDAQTKKVILNNHVELRKITSNPAQSIIDIGNITSWVRNDGFHDWKITSLWNGMYPNGIEAGLIYSEGIVWGGLVSDGNYQLVRVNGNTYGSGCSPLIRLYRVRPDYLTGDLTQDAADFYSVPIGNVTQEQIDSLRQQYQNDWNEWPADQGAPFKDVDSNGVYNPNVDIPGVPTSAQTIFIIYNDDLSAGLYGSIPIGLEIHETYWAYSDAGSIGNVIYKKVDLIYKGTQSSNPGSQIDSMYINQWADPDVGNNTDDFAGCDTALNLGYAYNSSNNDAVYQSFGLNPPAVGYRFLQGVSKFTGNPTDSAIFNFEWRKGYKYVNPNPMSTFIYIASGGVWADPNYDSTGTPQFYNYMRGYLPIPPYPAQDTFPSYAADYTPTGCYLYDGDPVSGTGKIDGVYNGPGDRRIIGVSGPFTMNLGDTAEVVIALVAGMGSNYLNSITEMKNKAIVSDTTYLGLVKIITAEHITGIEPEDKGNSVPNQYALYQNYPNPFNPSTAIKYSIIKNDFVTIKLYDILGREMETLVNENQKAGNYSINFNASNLPSGVYIYRITAGKFNQSRKMIILK